MQTFNINALGIIFVIIAFLSANTFAAEASEANQSELRKIRDSGNVAVFLPKKSPNYSDVRSVSLRYSNATQGRPIPYLIASTRGYTYQEANQFLENLQGQTNAFGSGANAIAEEAKNTHVLGEKLGQRRFNVTSELVVYNAGAADIAVGVKPILEITIDESGKNIHLKEIVVVDPSSGQLITYRNYKRSLYGSVVSPNNPDKAKMHDSGLTFTEKSGVQRTESRPNSDNSSNAGFI